jgi:hypothetical protein
VLRYIKKFCIFDLFLSLFFCFYFYDSFPVHFYWHGVFETMYLSPITWHLLSSWCSETIYLTPNYLVSLGSGSTSFWNSIFTSNEDRTHASAKDNSANRSYAVPTPNLEHSFSTIQLREVRYLINFLISAIHIH